MQNRECTRRPKGGAPEKLGKLTNTPFKSMRNYLGLMGAKHQTHWGTFSGSNHTRGKNPLSLANWRAKVGHILKNASRKPDVAHLIPSVTQMKEDFRPGFKNLLKKTIFTCLKKNLPKLGKRRLLIFFGLNSGRQGQSGNIWRPNLARKNSLITPRDLQSSVLTSEVRSYLRGAASPCFGGGGGGLVGWGLWDGKP